MTEKMLICENFKVYKTGNNDIDQIINIRIMYLKELDCRLSDTDCQKLLEQSREYFKRKMESHALHRWLNIQYLYRARISQKRLSNKNDENDC
jgi:hypothetical protein